MAVLEPLCLHIVNYSELGFPATGHSLHVKHFPSDPNCVDEWEIAFDQRIWIERSDFREVSQAGEVLCHK